MMKRKLLLGTVLVMCCGCSTMNNTEAGAVTGGLLGGILGTGIGLAAHNPAAGALIGAGAGAGLGALAGAGEDHREKKEAMAQAAYTAQAQQAAQQAAARAPSLAEIVQMARNGVPDVNIIAQIRGAGVAYQLNADDLSYLSANGVSSAVIIELQNSASRRAYATAPPVVYVRPVYYDPYPPPVIGVGFGYRRGW